MLGHAERPELSGAEGGNLLLLEASHSDGTTEAA
jgi:hypothetical protein